MACPEHRPPHGERSHRWGISGGVESDRRRGAYHRFRSHFPNDRPVALGCHDLTRRELEIVDLISEGLANAAIATRLGIAESTVKKHINRIFRKTGYQSRYELIICRPFPVTPAEPSP